MSALMRVAPFRRQDVPARLSLLTIAAGAAAALAAVGTVAVYAAVLWRIATNAYGATGDFLSFYAAGWLVRGSHAGDLYDPDTIEWAQRRLYPGDFDLAIGYPLPVFVAWLFAPFSALPFTLSFFLWMALNAVLLAGVVWALNRELAAVPASVRLAFAVTAALSMPAIATLVFGQVDLIALAGLLGGYLALRERRPALAGAALSIALVKPHLLAGVALMLLARREWKTIGWLSVIGLPLLVIPAFATDPATLAGNVRILASYPGAGDQLSVNAAMMSNWRGFVASATNSNDVWLWLPGLAAIAAAALALAATRWRMMSGPAAFDRGYALAMLLPLLVSPHLHTQSLVLMLLPAALALKWGVPASAARECQQTAVTWLLASYAALFFLPVAATAGLSLTVFVVVAAYGAAAFWWPRARASQPRIPDPTSWLAAEAAP